MKDFNLDILEPNLAFVLEEGASEVDGVHVLAKIKGEFFVPDGFSRNKRFYPKALWEKVLDSKDVKEELKNRTMFGAISHSTPINDESFRDGKFSHIVTKMYIDENGKGIGEALILNTPTGQILNTVARAGSKLFVSTRADGSFKGETNEGVPIVNKDTYKYHTTDFVLRPGFLKANPELAEAFNNIEHNDIQENEMSEKLLKSLTEENGNLKIDLSDLGKSFETLKAENSDTLGENVSLKEENDRLSKIEESNKELSEKLEEATKELDAYKAIDTAENISTSLDLVEKRLDEYEAFGTISELESVISGSEKMTEEISALGGMEEINKVITITETLINEKEELKVKNAISELAKELNVSEERITKVYSKLTVEEIKELFKDITPIKEDKEIEEDDSEDFKAVIEEDDADIKDKEPKQSRAASLMESFSRGR